MPKTSLSTHNSIWRPVIANFVLHFCESTAVLGQVCRNIYTALKPGGRAVGFVPNGVHDCRTQSKMAHILQTFGISPCVVADDVKDGDDMEIMFHSAGKKGKVTGKWYFRDTYEQCLREAGFAHVRWITPFVSQEGIQKYGQQHFQPFIAHPPIDIIFETTKS